MCAGVQVSVREAVAARGLTKVTAREGRLSAPGLLSQLCVAPPAY